MNLIALLMVIAICALIIATPIWLCVLMFKSVFSKPEKCRCSRNIVWNDIYDDDE